MANKFHKDVSGLDIHVNSYIQSSDPGAVGAGIAWLNTVSKRQYVRNSTNSGWDAVVAPECPIGSIIMWHKKYVELVLGSTPVLPYGWVECNGSTINDPESIFNGLTTPNINGQHQFIRGNSESGLLEDSQNKTHTHAAGSLTVPAHNHSINITSSVENRSHTHNEKRNITNNIALGSSARNVEETDTQTGNASQTHTHVVVGTSDNSSTLTCSGTSGSEGISEARPTNISMVFIFKIK